MTSPPRLLLNNLASRLYANNMNNNPPLFDDNVQHLTNITYPETLPSTRIYDLLIKNVSKGDPLTSEELSELKEFRATLSNDQWQYWLKFARNERKRLLQQQQQQQPRLIPQQQDYLEQNRMESPPIDIDISNTRDENDGDFESIIKSNLAAKSFELFPTLLDSLMTQENRDDLPEKEIEQDKFEEVLSALRSTSAIEPSSNPGFPKKPIQQQPQQPQHPPRSAQKTQQQNEPKFQAESTSLFPAPRRREDKLFVTRDQAYSIEIPIPREERPEFLQPKVEKPAEEISRPISFRADGNLRPSTSPKRLGREESYIPKQTVNPSYYNSQPIEISKPPPPRSQSAPRLKPAFRVQPETPVFDRLTNYTPLRQSDRKVNPNSQIGPINQLNNTFSKVSSSAMKNVPSVIRSTSPNRPNLRPPSPPQYHQSQPLYPIKSDSQGYSTLSNSVDIKQKVNYTPSQYHLPPSPPPQALTTNDLFNQLEEENKLSQIENVLHSTSETAKVGSQRIHSAFAAAKYLLQILDGQKAADPRNLQNSRAILSEMVSTLEKSKEHFDQIGNQTLSTYPTSSNSLFPPTTTTAALPASYAGEGSIRTDEDDFQSRQSSEYPIPVPVQHTLYATSSTWKAPSSPSPSNRTYKRYSPEKSEEYPGYPKTQYRQQPMTEDEIEYSRSSSPPNKLTGSGRWTAPAQSNLNGSSASYEMYNSIMDVAASLSENFQNQTKKSQDLTRKSVNLERYCIAQGPLVKTFEEYPLRIDLESNAVDVVWREARHGTNPGPATYRSQSNQLDVSGPKVLRRERFIFDELCYGNKAYKRLHEILQLKVKQSLIQSRNLVFLCTGCGEMPRDELEPPVMLALGSGGGTGIASLILTTVFKHIHSLKAATSSSANDSRNTTPVNASLSMSQSFKSSDQQGFLNSKLYQESGRSRVSMSAVLISGNNLMELLHPSFTASTPAESRPKIIRRQSGEIQLTNATMIDLQTVMDFERIVGLLLGRRAGISEALQLISQHNQNASTHLRPLNTYATWSTQSSNSQQDFSQQSDEYYLNSNDENDPDQISSTLLLTFHISIGSMGKIANNYSFRLVCPCGQYWTQPGLDLNILAEGITNLPHSLPPSVLSVSPMTMLLTDPLARPIDYLSIMSVNRNDTNGSRNANSNSCEKDYEIAMNALDALRISCIPK